MWGVIQRAPGSSISPLHDIVGRPLVARQLLWLRRIGCERVAVEVGPGPEGADLAAWLEGGDAACLDVVPVLSSRRLGGDEILRRAGCAPGTRVVAIQSDVLGDADPSRLFAYAAEMDVVVRLPPAPSLRSLPGGTLVVGAGTATAQEGKCDGWAVRIRDAADAFAVACLALSQVHDAGGAPGALSVPGSMRSPDVVAGRGAVVEPGAVVEGPTWIGPGAIVRAGAHVGPFSIIGPGAVVERGARLGSTRCEAATVVGEMLDVRELDVAAEGVRPISDPRAPRAALSDALMLDARPSLSRSLTSALVHALAMLTSPLLWIAYRGDVRRARDAVVDLAAGRRTLFGVGEPLLPLRGSDGLRMAASRAPRGLVDIEPALVLASAGTVARLRARAWYAEAKSPRIDVTLALRLLARGRYASRGTRSLASSPSHPTSAAASALVAPRAVRRATS
jgi:hypothetical protein